MSRRPTPKTLDQRRREAKAALDKAILILLSTSENDLEATRDAMRLTREASLALNNNVLQLSGRERSF